ncbi:aminoglycoside phosphotransferase family protein [Kribbella sp. CA-253562]|uniref:aminoglycoside phosphotransferase family protein n=1 Tax=Kribbella sp. CA-253562 TaxID=3239942 RepID=UPI003D89B199
MEALVSVGDRYVGKAPAFEADRPWWSEIEDVTAQLEVLLGVPTFVLRLVQADSAESIRGGRVVYHVQAAADPRPDALDPTPDPRWAEVIKPHPLRATWAEVDGPQRLADWACGIVGAGTPTQVKTWNLSCLIRIPSAEGGAWAKATSPFCSVDAEIIQHVRRYDAALAPTVLGVDLENRWSLLAHAPGIDCWEPDLPTVQDVVSRWVSVQARIAVEELHIPKLLPADLPAELDRLLAGEVGRQLSAEDLTRVRVLKEALPGLIEELESSGLPNTVVHGDFHPGNWRSDGTNRLIVDWADSYLGHPAADIQRLRDWLPEEKKDVAIETWSSAWQRELPDSQPLRALEPMTVIAQLLAAHTYQRFLDNIEPNERIYHEGDPAEALRAASEAAVRAGSLD